MRVWTMALPNWRKAKEVGIVYLDITVKTGDTTFSPTWDLLNRYKQGIVDNRGYAEEYMTLMRNSFRTNRSRWNEVLAMDEVVLACYCKAGAFCHRRLLANIFERQCDGTGLEFRYFGEITDFTVYEDIKY